MTTYVADVTPVTAPRPMVRQGTATTMSSSLGFFAMLAMLVVTGMAIVMVVTTQVGAQSRDLSALRREAAVQSYEVAALQTELESISSTGSLALRAAELGMVPNPYPAFVDLSTNSVLGAPQAVEGDEATYLMRDNAPAETTELAESVTVNESAEG